MRITASTLQLQGASLSTREFSENFQSPAGPVFGGGAMVSGTSASHSRSREEIRFEKEIAVRTLERLQLYSRQLRQVREGEARGTAAFSGGDGEGPMSVYSASYREEQQAAFRASGTIQTASGREIGLELTLRLAASYSDDRIMTGVFRDPLIINFDAPTALLDDTTFAFDIDNDGSEEQISLLKRGSGFLAYDANGNGVVDGGSELFGTKSGNGFGELARFDSDGNGWIDENDPIFKGLRIWSKTRGEDRLIALGEAGIGAVYLGAARTDYTLRGEGADALGQLRQTGLFLRENGDAGLIQQVDLAVEEAPEAREPFQGSIRAGNNAQDAAPFSKAGLIKVSKKEEVDPGLTDNRDQLEALTREQTLLTGEKARLEGKLNRMTGGDAGSHDFKQLENRLLLVRQNVAAVEGRLLLLQTGTLDLTG